MFAGSIEVRDRSLVTVASLITSGRSVVGVDWATGLARWAGRRATRHCFADVLGRIARTELDPPQPTTARLEEAGAVLRRYADRAIVGKYVLLP